MINQSITLIFHLITISKPNTFMIDIIQMNKIELKYFYLNNIKNKLYNTVKINSIFV